MAWLSLIVAVLCATFVRAHTVVTYPGWRGDNLITNNTFPYGMQWMYPCEFVTVRNVVLLAMGGLEDHEDELARTLVRLRTGNRMTV